MKEFEVAVIGGGPGGATTAALLAKNGVDVVLFERDAFPRFHIGESLLPYSRDVLEEIGVWDDMHNLFIKKYGAFFVDYQTEKQVYFDFADTLTGTHPYAFEVVRSEFDQLLLSCAAKHGVTIEQPVNVTDIEEEQDHIIVRTEHDAIKAKYVIDTTGRDRLLGGSVTTARPNMHYNHTAVFAHFDDVKRAEGKNEGDIIIGILPRAAWAWVIPFKDGRTSVGVVCKANEYRSHQGPPEGFLDKWLRQSTALYSNFTEAERVSTTRVVSNYSFQCDRLAGDRWALVGDAAGFLDPVFSSGVHLALHSAQYASSMILSCLKDGRGFQAQDDARVYEDKIRLGWKRFGFIIDLFYTMNFTDGMTRIMERDLSRRAFTSVLAGHVWDDGNPIFSLFDMGRFSQEVPVR